LSRKCRRNIPRGVQPDDHRGGASMDSGLRQTLTKQRLHFGSVFVSKAARRQTQE
jgi:hypothetical protein